MKYYRDMWLQKVKQKIIIIYVIKKGGKDMAVVLPVKDSDEIRKLISLKGETVRSFSLKNGISYGYLSQILNGRKPSPKVAKKISDGVERPIDSLFLFSKVAKSNTKSKEATK